MDWKDDILRSLEGIRRAEPTEGVYRSIRDKIYRTGKRQFVPSFYVMLTAACFTILITANIWALTARTGNSTLPSIYEMELANFDLYQ